MEKKYFKIWKERKIYKIYNRRREFDPKHNNEKIKKKEDKRKEGIGWKG